MARQKFDNMGYRLMGRPRSAPRQTWRKEEYSQGRHDVPDGTLCDETPEAGRTYTRRTWPPRGRGRGESLYSPRRMKAKLRAIEVLRMRIANHTWAHIARVLGFKDASGAYRAYRRAIDRVDWDNQRRRQNAS